MKQKNPDDNDALINSRPLILLGRDETVYSETFIANHVSYLDAEFLSLKKYMPIGKKISRWDSKDIYYGLKSIPNKVILKHILAKYKGRAILAEYGVNGANVLPVCKELGLSLVVHFHGYDAHKRDIVEEYKDKYLDLFNYAKAIIVVSSYMKDAVINLGAPPEKVHHIVYGIEPELFQMTNVANNPPVFFAGGRFTEKKAPYLTILAFKKVLQNVPEARLRFAGAGPLLPMCKDLVESLGMRGRIEFLGIIPAEKMAAELQNCRAFIQHSIIASDGDSEGTPNTILEAGISGVPVVATRHAGIKDVVIHNKTGFLVIEKDIDSMAEYIVELGKNPKLAKEIGGNAHKHVLENYSINKSISKLKAVIYA